MLARIGNSRFMRFFGVSSVGTVADYISALALHFFLGLSGVVASTLGFLIGTVLNYLGHHHITFSTGDGSPASLFGFLRYLAAVMASLVVRLIVLVGFERAMAVPFWIALTVAFGASFLCSYFISLFWVFRRNT
ncbi:GtrA family protein [Defluviimonas sp. WL0050]|uniref:GtrA family protein n=1 Tax=Albidovulum litorale TaxID=2984134 RepID=A0ABT2ZK18_9RHOB|nr:GtrA family protein [Defluviimonas sp. WL0050]MCV2871484.1 GtrA family protein [Defluviimonas sp. WL0050]